MAVSIQEMLPVVRRRLAVSCRVRNGRLRCGRPAEFWIIVMTSRGRVTHYRCRACAERLAREKGVEILEPVAL